MSEFLCDFQMAATFPRPPHSVLHVVKYLCVLLSLQMHLYEQYSQWFPTILAGVPSVIREGRCRRRVVPTAGQCLVHMTFLG